MPCCYLFWRYQDKNRSFIWRQVVHQLTADVFHCFQAEHFAAVIDLVRVIRSKGLFMEDTEPVNMQFVRCPCRWWCPLTRVTMSD
jgi:hypothetical protein